MCLEINWTPSIQLSVFFLALTVSRNAQNGATCLMSTVHTGDHGKSENYFGQDGRIFRNYYTHINHKFKVIILFK